MASLFTFIQDRVPRLIRVETLHLLKFFETPRSEILVIDNAVLANNESSHSGYAIFGGSSDQGKASYHHVFHQIVHLTERRRWTLPFQNFEEVAVVGLGATGITLFDCRGNFLADRASPGAIGVLPGQAVLLAGRADDPLCVLVYFVPLAFLEGVVVLRLHITVTNLDRVQFIGANASVEKLLLAGFGVKKPLAVLLHDRHRERPVLVPNYEESAVAAFRVHGDVLLFMSLSSKIGGMLAVLGELPTKHDVMASRAKNLSESDHVKFVGSSHQCIRGLLRCIEALRANRLGRRFRLSLFRGKLLSRRKNPTT